MNEDRQADIKEALSLLSQTATAIYNIEGDKWQMAFEVLESLYCYLKTEGGQK